MAEHTVSFSTADGKHLNVKASTGMLLAEVAQIAGIEISQPCGGQGRCGRCAVQVTSGEVRRRSTMRLSSEALEQGFALACQTVVEGDVSIFVPEQEKIERKLTTDRVAAEVSVPVGYDFHWSQTIRRYNLLINEPSMDDQTDDWSRLQTALRQQHKIEKSSCSMNLLRRIGPILRDAGWQVCVIGELLEPDTMEIIDVLPKSDRSHVVL